MICITWQVDILSGLAFSVRLLLKWPDSRKRIVTEKPASQLCSTKTCFFLHRLVTALVGFLYQD